jgi:hypothetical protein
MGYTRLYMNRMNARRVLLEWPARAFDLWWTCYRIVLGVTFMVVVTVTVIALTLDLAFGIRWGW